VAYSSSNTTVTSSAVKLVPANPARSKLYIANLGAVTLFIGGPNVSTTNGYPLAASTGTFIDYGQADKGDVWAVTSTTCDVRVLEL